MIRKEEKKKESKKKKYTDDKKSLFKVERKVDHKKEKKEVKKEIKPKEKVMKELPIKILGMTKEPGELHFAVKYKSEEVGLMKVEDAHNLVPRLCCKYYSKIVKVT